MSIRLSFQQFLERRIYRETGRTSSRSAVIFSPHQDDETLGCGGTIYQKRQAGVEVSVVYLTDGGISHRRFKSSQEMSAIRRAEAIQACRILGVSEEHVSFLDFPNGALRKHLPEACQRVEEWLRLHPAEEVYIPCALDYHDEHRYTNQVVSRALLAVEADRQLPCPVQVLEYPVWYWDHWPWVPLPAQPAEARKRLYRRMLDTAFGLRSLRMFDLGVSIEDCLEVKRKALFAHASQVTRLVDDPGWATLFDIADGEFARRFLQPVEVFRRSARISPVE